MRTPDEIRADITNVKASLNTLRQRLKALTAELEEALAADLKVYPAGTPLDSIQWERYEDNAETRSRFNDLFWVWAWGGSKPNDPMYPPYKHVYVEGTGELRVIAGVGWNAEKQQGGQAGDDGMYIAEQRILDVTAERWVARCQEGDDNLETDPADQDALLRDYAKRMLRGECGLRYPIATWSNPEHRKTFIEAYGGEPTVLNPKRQIPVTPAG